MSHSFPAWLSFSLVVAGVTQWHLIPASGCGKPICPATDELVLLQTAAQTSEVVDGEAVAVNQTGGGARHDQHILRLASHLGDTATSNATASATQSAAFVVLRATEFFGTASTHVVLQAWSPSFNSACIATIGLGLFLSCCWTRAQDCGASGSSDHKLLARSSPPLPDLSGATSLESDKNQQCILFVPARVGRDGPADVADCSGRTLLRIEPRGPSTLQSLHARSVLGSSRSHGATDLWRLLICSPSDHRSILAQCCPVGKDEFHLRHANGKYFGKLTLDAHSDGAVYVLSTRAGRVFKYRGEASGRVFQVKEGSDFVVATVEPADASCGHPCAGYKLAAGRCDVGAILCGLLCIDWHRASQSP